MSIETLFIESFRFEKTFKIIESCTSYLRYFRFIISRKLFYKPQKHKATE